MAFSKASAVLLLAALAAVLLPTALGTDCCECAKTGVCPTVSTPNTFGESCSAYGSAKCYRYHPSDHTDWYGTCIGGTSPYQIDTTGLTFLGIGCGVSRGDPVLVDFTGSSFELVGEAGKWFNLISEATHNVNMRLVNANMSSKANGGTLIDGVAMLYNDNKVEAYLDAAGELTVMVNEQTITKDALLKANNNAIEVMLDDHTAVVVQLYQTNFGHSMHIITPLLDTTFFATAPGLDDYYQEYLRAYLNFHMGLVDTTVSGIHGLLGQTAPNSIAANKPKTLAASSSTAIDLFNGEGEESDYIVDSAFATEFKFTQFGKAPVPIKQQGLKIARRSMIEQDKPITVFATMKLHA